MAARLAAIRIMQGRRQSRAGAALPGSRGRQQSAHQGSQKRDPAATPLLQSQLLLYLLHTEQSLSQHIYRRPLVSPRLQRATRDADTRKRIRRGSSDRCRANRHALSGRDFRA